MFPASTAHFLRGPLLVVLGTAAVLLLLAHAAAPSFTWNLSPSLPRGLYRFDRQSPATRGALVSFAPPRAAADLIAARGYLPASVSMLKMVVAVPGDSVCIDDTAFVANGTRIGALAHHDSAGRPLVPFLFCGVVPAGSAFVAAPTRLSFDSRYFGPVPLASLTVAVAVWTY